MHGRALDSSVSVVRAGSVFWIIMKASDFIRIGIALATIAIGVTAYSLLVAVPMVG